MSKSIYCVGKIKGNQTIMNVAVNNSEVSDASKPAKRIDIVTIRMVKEGSILYKNRKVGSPNDAYILFKEFLADADREMLVVCSLDTKNQPTSINVASIGSISSAIISPREVFKPCLLSNAASLIICHNHPSGDPSESIEDINITKRLYECGKLLGIDLIDHIIIGDERFVSLKEKGII